MLTGAGMHSHLKNLRLIQAELTTSSIGQYNKSIRSRRKLDFTIAATTIGGASTNQVLNAQNNQNLIFVNIRYDQLRPPYVSYRGLT